MPDFKVQSNFQPAGDQPAAIERLTEILSQDHHALATLLGVTGSGKTFTMAKVVERLNLPTLVITHNKTLAAQLFQEFRELFPENRVEYFVSYYDYYQPEAYLPGKDLYIEKDSSINEKIDRLRHSATMALLERRDTLVVSSVSCIYGLGNPKNYKDMNLTLVRGEEFSREKILERLVDMQYKRTTLDLARNYFRVQGDVIEIYASYSEQILRVELFGDEIERITELDRTDYHTLQVLDEVRVYPAQHYVLPEGQRDTAFAAIEAELEERMFYFKEREKRLELQRISERTRYDLEMMKELGYCSGIENYSRHLDGRQAGEPPHTLIDFFPDDFLMIIDESHMTVPQLNGMYNGDRARKANLVDFGFRLPSAFDNRPLRFPEFERYMKKVSFVSATPGQFEQDRTQGNVVEQLIRPTGLIDPEIIIRPVEGQVDDLVSRIKERVDRNERVLVTTLTKRMSEDLTRYLQDFGFQVNYLHSEVETLERTKILRDLRLAKFDVLVGINLLREGLDLPEVSLVAILDADKEGFLRSSRALIQTCGRAARNVNGQVIFYADRITEAIRITMEETERRRTIQLAWNKKHGITPQTIIKAIHDDIMPGDSAIEVDDETALAALREQAADLEAQMRQAAEDLDFERAATIRDRLRSLGLEPGPKKV